MIHPHKYIDPFVFSDPFNNFVEGNIVLDQPFDPKLEDHTSQEFLDMQTKLTTPLKNLYCGTFQCCDIKINGFRQGSVIAEFLVSIASGSLSSCDITAKLISQISHLPATIGGINVTPGTLTASKLLMTIRRTKTLYIPEKSLSAVRSIYLEIYHF